MNYELEIPRNTIERSPLSVTYDIGYATPRLLLIGIPDGHKYLARLAILSKGQLLAPAPNSGAKYIRGNNETKEIPISTRLEGPPYTITLIGWSEDDAYSHTFYLEVK